VGKRASALVRIRDLLDDRRRERGGQQAARFAFRQPARAQVEQLLGVELADGRAVGALYVVRIDLELRFRVDLRVLAEQQIVVVLPRVDALATRLDDDLAVEYSAAAVADDAAEALGADGRTRSVTDQRVVIDVLVMAS